MVIYYLKSLEPNSKRDSSSVIKPSFNNESRLTFLSFIEKFSGNESPKKYLFLFQNSMELRPTGGFIGSFAVVDIDKGKIVKKEEQATAAIKAGNLKKANRKTTAANRKTRKIERATGKQVKEVGKKSKMTMTKKVVKKKKIPVKKY
jgi:hypothetical protein